jgi:hypothetical protein
MDATACLIAQGGGPSPAEKNWFDTGEAATQCSATAAYSQIH